MNHSPARCWFRDYINLPIHSCSLYILHVSVSLVWGEHVWSRDDVHVVYHVVGYTWVNTWSPACPVSWKTTWEITCSIPHVFIYENKRSVEWLNMDVCGLLMPLYFEWCSYILTSSLKAGHCYYVPHFHLFLPHFYLSYPTFTFFTPLLPFLPHFHLFYYLLYFHLHKAGS